MAQTEQKQQANTTNPRNRRQDERPRNARPQNDDGFEQVAVETRRVTKVTAGAKRFRFSALVVVGNKAGKVGVGLGKGADPRLAIEKAAKYAKAHLIDVTMKGTTIPHLIEADYGASKILLKPASQGTGIIAGGSMRAVVELAGIKDIRGKVIGGGNKVNTVYATLSALSLLRDQRI